MKQWALLVLIATIIFSSFPIYAKGQKTHPDNGTTMSQEYPSNQSQCR